MTQINLPAAVKPASTSQAYMAMFWLHVPATASIKKLSGWLKSGSYGWGAYSNNAGGGLQYAFFADGQNFTITLPGAGLYLICLGRVGNGGSGFLARARIYNAAGLVNSSSLASGATAAQPAATPATVGEDGTFAATGPSMRFYRGRFLDVLTATGIANSAWFDALADAEWSANKGRAGTEWNVA